MQLIDLRNEVLAHGFDPTQFGAARVNTYLNDGYQFICSRVQYYVTEATQDFTTITGTAIYTFPADFAEIRSLRDTNRNLEMTSVGLRKIDRSPTVQGAPLVYALDGANLHLYPTPDASSYPMELRYWRFPPNLVNDTDVPTIPAVYHRLIWMYAVAQSYKAEDDFTMGQQWQNDFTQGLSQFIADMKFPSTDTPTQADSMWNAGPSVGARGWSIYGGVI